MKTSKQYRSYAVDQEKYKISLAAISAHILRDALRAPQDERNVTQHAE